MTVTHKRHLKWRPVLLLCTVPSKTLLKIIRASSLESFFVCDNNAKHNESILYVQTFTDHSALVLIGEQTFIKYTCWLLQHLPL